MAHAFKIIPAKPTFGNLKESVYQSDYIQRKKAQLVYFNTSNCNIGCCNKLIKSSDYNMYNLFNYGRLNNNIQQFNLLPCDKQNLVVGQYVNMDLSGACCVITGPPCISDCSACLSPSPINLASTFPFYITNTIDPIGNLFGKTQCGELNYTRYMVLQKNKLYPYY